MTQNAVFLDCSSKVPTFRCTQPPVVPKILDEVRKNGDEGRDEKLIIKFMQTYSVFMLQTMTNINGGMVSLLKPKKK